MSENFEIRAPIKDELQKCLIFGLEARLPIGIILSHCGLSHEVMPLMQTLAHPTRAFIWNANGLRGFLVEQQIIPTLKAADKQDELQAVNKFQEVDSSKLKEELCGMRKTEQMTHLQNHYPSLALFMLNHLNQAS